MAVLLFSPVANPSFPPSFRNGTDNNNNNNSNNNNNKIVIVMITIIIRKAAGGLESEQINCGYLFDTMSDFNYY